LGRLDFGKDQRSILCPVIGYPNRFLEIYFFW